MWQGGRRREGAAGWDGGHGGERGVWGGDDGRKGGRGGREGGAQQTGTAGTVGSGGCRGARGEQKRGAAGWDAAGWDDSRRWVLRCGDGGREGDGRPEAGQGEQVERSTGSAGWGQGEGEQWGGGGSGAGKCWTVGVTRNVSWMARGRAGDGGLGNDWLGALAWAETAVVTGGDCGNGGNHRGAGVYRNGQWGIWSRGAGGGGRWEAGRAE